VHSPTNTIDAQQVRTNDPKNRSNIKLGVLNSLLFVPQKFLSNSATK